MNAKRRVGPPSRGPASDVKAKTRKPRGELRSKESHYADQPPTHRDGWSGVERVPMEDSGESDADWLWARSHGRDIEISITDPRALAVLDAHVWQPYPYTGYEDVRAALSEMAGPYRRRGRPQGDEHPNAKLSEDDVIRLKVRILDGEPIVHIARSEGMPYKRVYDIKSGRTWSHIKVAA